MKRSSLRVSVQVKQTLSSIINKATHAVNDTFFTNYTTKKQPPHKHVRLTHQVQKNSYLLANVNHPTAAQTSVQRVSVSIEHRHSPSKSHDFAHCSHTRWMKTQSNKAWLTCSVSSINGDFSRVFNDYCNQLFLRGVSWPADALHALHSGLQSQ